MADARSGPDVAHLVAEHHQAVYRYAYRLTGSIHDAEDLTQQVFLAAQRKMGQLRSIDDAGAWLFAILRNCFLKDRQRRRRPGCGFVAQCGWFQQRRLRKVSMETGFRTP